MHYDTRNENSIPRMLQSITTEVGNTDLIRIFIRVSSTDPYILRITRQIIIDSIQKSFLVRRSDILTIVTMDATSVTNARYPIVISVTMRLVTYHPVDIPELWRDDENFLNDRGLRNLLQ